MSEPEENRTRPAARYTRGETITMWLCWLTPGIATGLSMAAYSQWFHDLEEAWFPVTLLGSILIVLLACAGFAGYIDAGKREPGQSGGRLLDMLTLFLCAQIFVAPLIGFLVTFFTYGWKEM